MGECDVIGVVEGTLAKASRLLVWFAVRVYSALICVSPVPNGRLVVLLLRDCVCDGVISVRIWGPIFDQSLNPSRLCILWRPSLCSRYGRREGKGGRG